MTEQGDLGKDDVVIQRARKRLLRAYKRVGTWRGVAAEMGVNHGNLVLLMNHGHAPSSVELRTRMGLPRVLPSERKPRAKKVIPMLGSECWKCMAFKKIRPGKKKGR